jgi:hypothetical protein
MSHRVRSPIVRLFLGAVLIAPALLHLDAPSEAAQAVAVRQIRLPLLWCVTEGSPLAGDTKAGGTVNSPDFNSITQRASDLAWKLHANIVFFAKTATPKGPRPVLVIGDPDTSVGEKGDIDAGFLSLEPANAASSCKQAWKARHPSWQGIIAVSARKFVNAGLTQGVTPPVPKALRVKSRVPGTGKRGDDLCGKPRHLTPDDVIPQLWTVVVDPRFYGITYSGSPEHTLAHELGHLLMLGHGNGLDDNLDGAPPLLPRGSRRYDEYCDPLWLVPPENVKVAEDELASSQDCEHSSLMRDQGCTSTYILRPLQVETARAVAVQIPGHVVVGPEVAGAGVSP